MDKIEGSSALQGARVLIVEDEYSIAKDLAVTCMASGGIVAGLFSQSEPAIGVVRDAGCDAAILDIRLHDETTYALAEALQWKSIPFVFTTGYYTNAIPYRLRLIPVWQKPSSAAFLMRGLATMVDLRRAVFDESRGPERPDSDPVGRKRSIS